MIVHEGVTEVINAVVIDRQEIPRFVPQNPGGSVVDRAVFRQNFGKLLCPILVAVHLLKPHSVRQKKAQPGGGCLWLLLLELCC